MSSVGISMRTGVSYSLITDGTENITWTSNNTSKLYVRIKHTDIL